MTKIKIYCNSNQHKQWNEKIRHQICSNSKQICQCSCVFCSFHRLFVHVCFVLFIVCLYICVLFFSSFVCTSAYANVYFKTTIIKQNIKIIILQNNIHVSEVHCGIECRSIRSGASGLPYYCAPLVCISEVIELLAVYRHNKPKTQKKTYPGGC